MLLLGIPIILNSCVKDDDFTQNTTNKSKVNALTIKRINFDEIKTNKTLYRKIKTVNTNLKEANKSNAKTINDSLTNITINTNFANYIINENGLHSYTFMVTNTPEGSGLKNVLLSLQPDGTFKEYLIHYDVTEQELTQIDNGEAINLTGRVSSIPLNSNFNDHIFGKVIYQDGCTTITSTEHPCTNNGNHSYPTPCNEGEDPSGFAKPDTYNIINTCGDGPTGGSTGNWFPGGSTSGGHNNGGGGPTTITTYCSPRNCPSVDEPAVDTPEYIDNLELISDCNTLSDLSNSPDFTPRIQELFNSTTSNTEVSYYGETSSNTTTFPNDANHRFESTPSNGASINMPLPTTAINSVIHNHFNDGSGCFSIFSPEDLSSFFKLFSNVNNINYIDNLDNFTAEVVTPGPTSSPNDDTIYAITISSAADFTAVADLYSSNTQLIEEEYKIAGISPVIGNNLNEKRLAVLFKELKMGMTLYKGDKNNLNSWTRIKAKNNGDIKEKNCN